MNSISEQQIFGFELDKVKKHGRNYVIWSFTIFAFPLLLSGQKDTTWARHILLLKCMSDLFDILMGKKKLAAWKIQNHVKR